MKLSRSKPPVAANAFGSVLPRKLKTTCRSLRSEGRVVADAQLIEVEVACAVEDVEDEHAARQAMRLQLIVTRPGELPGLIVPATITSPVALITPSLPAQQAVRAPISKVVVLMVLLLRISVPVPPGPAGVAPTPT